MRQHTLASESKPHVPDRGKDRLVWVDNVWQYKNAVVPNPAQDRQKEEDKQTAEEKSAMLSVGLSAPTRRGFNIDVTEASQAGSPFSRLSEPLGRFCASPHGPANAPLGDHCWQAGQRYAEIVREFKNALGFDVQGWAPSDRGFGALDQSQIEARKELAISRKREADEVLRVIKIRLPNVLERLCSDQLEPYSSDSGIIIAGLVALAIEWEFLKRRFGEG